MIQLRRVSPAIVALVPLVLGACAEEQGAYGDASSIVTAVPSDVWDQVQDSVYGALEPTIYTVRDEKTFTVTHVDPRDGATWGDLMRFRQLLVVGPADADWVAPVLAAAREEDRGGGVVLRGEDVAAGPAHFGTQRNQRLDEHGRLDGHVQAAHDNRALERLLLRVALPNGHKARPLNLGNI